MNNKQTTLEKPEAPIFDELFNKPDPKPARLSKKERRMLKKTLDSKGVFFFF